MSLLVLTAVRLLCQCWENVAALSLPFLCHQLANSLCNTSAQTCGRLTLCAMSAQPLGRVQAGTHIHKQFGWALQEKQKKLFNSHRELFSYYLKIDPCFLKIVRHTFSRAWLQNRQKQYCIIPRCWEKQGKNNIKHI